MQRSKLTSYLQLHFIIFIWGFTGVMGKLITLPSTVLVWYRMLIAAITIVLYLRIRGKKLVVDRKTTATILAVGLVIALHWIAFFQSIKEANVSVALATLSTGALFASFIEPIFYKRKISVSEVVMSIMVLGGLSVMLGVSAGYQSGILYALLAAFLSALFSVLNGKLASKYDPSIITLYEMIGGFLFISLIWGWDGEFWNQIQNISWRDFGFLLFLGVICTAYAFIISVKIMRFISPYTMMLSINMEPIYGIVVAWLLFGESEEMNLQFYIGAGIIMATVFVNSLYKISRRKLVQRKANFRPKKETLG